MISINESPALKNRSIFKKLIAIFFIQASSASAFAVFYSGLSLYLTKSQNLTSHVATLITGMFLSLNYFLPLIGGLMATHLISYKKLYCLGSSLGFIGCLVLSNKINLYLGLALFLMASLVTNVCLNMFITQMFDSSQVNQRRVAFIWNYIGMNLGFLIGYFLTGLHSISSNYSGIFNIIAIPLCASIILALLFLKEEKQPSKNSAIFQVFSCLSIMVVISLVIKLLFENAEDIHQYLTLMSLIFLGGLIWYGYSKTDHKNRTNLKKFVIYSVLAIAFWTLYMLTPIAFMQLIEHRVNRNIFGVTLATQWIVNINSIVILSIAPILTLILEKQKKTFSILHYFRLAFMSSSIGFIILSLGIYFSDLYLIPVWSILGYLGFLAIAEIFISPIGNSIIGELIEDSIKPIMTGAWSMNISIGSLLASILSNRIIMPYLSMEGSSWIKFDQLQPIIQIIALALLLSGVFLYCSQKNLRLSKGKYDTV